jgi:hypothetical protein
MIARSFHGMLNLCETLPCVNAAAFNRPAAYAKVRVAFKPLKLFKTIPSDGSNPLHVVTGPPQAHAVRSPKLGQPARTLNGSQWKGVLTGRRGSKAKCVRRFTLFICMARILIVDNRSFPATPVLG